MEYSLQLLGPPLIHTPLKPVVPDRRLAGMLAYLALEGPTHKYKLAGFLWPDSEETTARNNMRQMLRRIRLNLHDIVVGEDLIELRPELEVDVKKLSYLETPSLEMLKQDVELLAGLEFDDTYDFADWLAGAREELRDLRSRSARSEAERLERMGNHKLALEYAQVWVRLEPLSEEAHRLVIRLHYLLGDRGAALAQFERCKQILQQELGADPLPETQNLLRLIEQGAELQGARPKTKEATLPTAILRPPVLAGREREWALMEEAWAQGQIIFITGEPGVGKTRLALDFAASKGRVFHFKARPGDAGVPLATQARALRETLEADPGILQRIPVWARKELPRLLPELAEGDELPPLASEADKLRFYEAIAETVKAQPTRITVADDVQFSDSATNQTTGYIMTKFASSPSASKPRIINVFRRGELNSQVEAGLRQYVENGLGVWIEVDPLSTEAVSTMLQALPDPGLAEMAETLKRFTGGNPLFILETLKDLIESGTLQQGFSARFTPPGKVLSLITRRLQRLSPLATNLVRCAAVARTQFTLELAGAVLERPAFELAEAHAELETAQVLRGNAFTHDLVFEAVLSGIPSAVKQVLHSKTAKYLQSKEANPALIGGHWLEGAEPAQAAAWLLKAAEQAHALGLFDEAIRQYKQVVEIATDPMLRLQARVGQTHPLHAQGHLDQAEALIQEVLAQTTDPRIRALALDSQQSIRVTQGLYHEAEQVIAQALPLAEGLGDIELTENLRFSKGFVLTRMGRNKEAMEVLEPLLPRFRQRPPSYKRYYMTTTLGFAYVALGRHAEGMALHSEALSGAKSIGSTMLQAVSANQMQVAHNVAGTPSLAFAQSEEALKLGEFLPSQMLHSTLAHGYMLANRASEAIPHLEWLIQHAADPSLVGMAWARLARARVSLGLDHRSALAEAVQRFEATQLPSARLEVVGVALEHGDVAQQAWAKEAIKKIESDKLLPFHLAEYERLRKLAVKG